MAATWGPPGGCRSAPKSEPLPHDECSWLLGSQRNARLEIGEPWRARCSRRSRWAIVEVGVIFEEVDPRFDSPLEGLVQLVLPATEKSFSIEREAG
jgi:hypothetical protein